MNIKTTFLIIALVAVIAACKKEGKGPTTLAGKWKLDANLISIGGPPYWVKENSQPALYVQFNNNGSVNSNIFQEYPSYQIKDSVTVTLLSPSNSIHFRYRLRKDSLYLSPADVLCIEGCAMRFLRVGD